MIRRYSADDETVDVSMLGRPICPRHEADAFDEAHGFHCAWDGRAPCWCAPLPVARVRAPWWRRLLAWWRGAPTPVCVECGCASCRGACSFGATAVGCTCPAHRQHERGCSHRALLERVIEVRNETPYQGWCDRVDEVARADGRPPPTAMPGPGVPRPG